MLPTKRLPSIWSTISGRIRHSLEMLRVTKVRLTSPHPAWSHFQAISLQVFFSCRAWYRATAAWPTCAATWRGSTENFSTSAHFATDIRLIGHLNSIYIYLPHSHGQLHVHNEDHLEHHIFIPFFLKQHTRQTRSKADTQRQWALMCTCRCVLNRPHFPVC